LSAVETPSGDFYFKVHIDDTKTVQVVEEGENVTVLDPAYVREYTFPGRIPDGMIREEYLATQWLEVVRSAKEELTQLNQPPEPVEIELGIE